MREPLQWSFPIGRLFGAAIRIHIMFPLFVVGLYLKALKDYSGTPGAAASAAIFFGLMFLSVLLHEYGHVFAARSVGGEANEVILWPLGGLAMCEVPHQPRRHFLTALAGPLVNLMLCVLSAAFLVGQLVWPPINPITTSPIVPQLHHLANGEALVSTWYLALAFQMFWINWALFLFNLLPAWPLDGGRMLHAILWARTDEREADGMTAYTGFGIMLLMCVVAIYADNVLLFALTIFIYVNCRQLLQQAEFGRDELGFSGEGGLNDDAGPTRRPRPSMFQRWRQRRAAQQAAQEQQQREEEERRLDELLDKVQNHGKNSLTAEEQRFLNRVSSRYRNNR